MFGFSLTKLLFTIFAVVVVWQGFKWFARMQEKSVSAKAAPKATQSKTSNADKVEEMVKCDACGTFVAPGAKSCGRDDCPFPG